MKNTITFLIAIGLFISGLVYYYWDKEQKRKRRELEERLVREEAARKILHDFFKVRLDKIKKAKEDFTKYLSNEHGYFSNYQLAVWNKQYSTLFTEMKDKTFEYIKLSNDEVGIIKSFINYSKNSASLRTEFNKQFIPYELKSYKDFFKKIEKHGLDKEQQIAVVTDDDNNIVIAGAGSGKTTTIVGKVNYVMPIKG